MSQTWQKMKRGKDMKIRLIGFLTKSQIEDSMAQLDRIVPEKGAVHIRKGVSFTYTFKGDKPVRVTIRRAPNFKFLNDDDQVVSPEEPAAKPEAASAAPESKFKVGDKVRINWRKTQYIKSPAYRDNGVVVKTKVHRDNTIRYVVSAFNRDEDVYELIFREDHLESYVEETKAQQVDTPQAKLKVGDIVKVKYPSEVDTNEYPYYMSKMEEYAGKDFRITLVSSTRGVVWLEPMDRSSGFGDVSDWSWNEKWVTLVSKKDA